MKSRNVIQEVYIRDSMIMERKIGSDWYKIEDAMKKESSIPIYYQELQPRDPSKYKFKPEDIIGTATNVRTIKDGKVVCDVTLNPFSSKSEHFTGIIDNYGMSVHREMVNNESRQKYKLERFIVYDKYKKQEVDKYVRKQGKHNGTTKKSGRK